eukprot:jgi/Tetstr1/466383/TSEL_010912.t1
MACRWTERRGCLLALLLATLCASDAVAAHLPSVIRHATDAGVVADVTAARSARVRPKSPTCDLCEDNWLFLLSPGGRTGSTTALTMFGSLPGVELAGEHMGLLLQEMNIHRLIERNYDQPGVAAFRHRPNDMHALKCNLQEKVKRIILGTDYEEVAASTHVLGFKEIRYRELPILRFISEVFPCARFIFTYREDTGARVTAEGFTQDLAAQWAESGELFHGVHRLFGSHAVGMIPVEGMTAEAYNAVLRDVVGMRGCSFSTVVHDNANGGYTEGGQPLLDGTCDHSGVDFRLSPDEIARRAAHWDALDAEQRRHAEERLAAATSAAGAVSSRLFSALCLAAVATVLGATAALF